jgi:hypothetical protein
MFKNILVTFTTLVIISCNSYAQCDIKKIDVNNKYLITMEILDIIDLINVNEGRLEKSSKSENRVDLLYAYKRQNIDYLCAIDKINYFKTTDKEGIKKGIIYLEKYLNTKVTWNKKLQKTEEDYLSSNSDLSKFENSISDLKIEKDEFPKQLASVTRSLPLYIYFEESDDLSIDYQKISTIKKSFIWVTRKERNNLIDKCANIFKRSEKEMSEGIATNIFIGLSIFVESTLSFKNNNIVHKEDIIKNYKIK